MTETTAAATQVAAVPLEGSGAPFSRTALWVIGGLVLASLIAVVALTLLGEDLKQEPSSGADGYSASAIGHRGLIKLLRKLDIPVVVSQSESAAKAKSGLLVIAEPVVTEDEASAKRFREMVHAAPRVLVVLPKWWSTGSHGHPGWARSVELVPTTDVDAVLAALDLTDVKVIRSEHDYTAAAGAVPAEGLRPEITIHNSAQTLRDAPLDRTYQLGDQGDVLLGTAIVGGTEVTLLTDPDVMNNHGLDEGKNARFAVGLIDELRQGGPVVFDEVGHGYTLEPSIWKLMLRWPLVLATLQALACILVLLLATVGRFGPAASAGRAIAPGKDFLIRNTAALLRYGGHDGEALQRYLSSAVHHVRATLHAPRDLTAATMMTWLERIRVARNGTIALPELEREVAAASVDPAFHKRIPDIAMRIHRWRQEMTHGSGKHQ